MTEKVKLQNVRIAFPNLFEPDSYTRYGATFIIEPDNPGLKTVNAAIKKLVDAELKGKMPGPSNVCLKKGSEKSSTYAGFTESNYFISASRKEPFKPNQIIHRDKSAITTDGAIYAGCYVNVVLELWAQDNQYGKRINASPVGIQFVKDGDRFGRGASDLAEDDFDELPELEDDSAAGSPEDLF
jgi:hypothetical protein